MKHILTLLLFLSCCCVFGQNQISKKDKKTFATFSNELLDGHSEKTLKLVDSTYRIAIKQNNKLLEILMLNILAKDRAKKGDFNSSTNLYLKGYDNIQNLEESYLKDSLLTGNLYFHGIVYYDSGEFTKATTNLNNALVIAKKNKDSVYTGACFNLLGGISAKQESFDDAAFYYKECLKYDTSDAARYYINGNLGTIYAEKKEYDLAEKYFLKTLKATDENNNLDLFISNSNLGYLYSEIENHLKSHDYFLKADEYAVKTKDKLNELRSKTNLITSFTNIKDFISAKQHMRICDSLLKEVDSDIMNVDYYQAVSESASKMKDYRKALNYSQKYIIAKDSVFSKEKTKISKELKIKYESDLKEAEIVSQKKLIKTKETQNTVLLISLGLILASMLSMFILYKKRLAIQKALLKKQEELANEKMNIFLEKQKVKTYQSHIEGQNKERERIAKDLHDSVSGNIAAIKMKLLNLKITQSKEIDTVISNLDSTYNEVRTISHNLISQDIIKQTFVENIGQLISLYQSETLKINVDIFPDKEINKLHQKIEVEVHRILQELITNIVKHANATICTINITLHDNYLNVIVEDNGVGYNTNKKSNGIGLNNILSRVKLMNGSVDIDSIEGKGTTVNINIPID